MLKEVFGMQHVLGLGHPRTNHNVGKSESIHVLPPSLITYIHTHTCTHLDTGFIQQSYLKIPKTFHELINFYTLFKTL